MKYSVLLIISQFYKVREDRFQNQLAKEMWTSEIPKIQHSHARTWRSGTRCSVGFPVPIPIKSIAIKVIVTFWILFSKSLNANMRRGRVRNVYHRHHFGNFCVF
jgi:hypothetical protein